MNASGVALARMPAPVADDDSVLVRVHYSMISVGTEVAPLKISSASQENIPERVSAKLQLARLYLGAAIRNPRRAIERSLELTRDFFSAPEMPSLIPEPSEKLSWELSEAVSLEVVNELCRLKTSRSTTGYQAMSTVIATVPKTQPIVRIRGSVKGGSIAIGCLNESRTNWLGIRTFLPGDFADELIFSCEGNASFTVVIANAGCEETVEVDISEFTVRHESKSGTSFSELDQQGWNVGYSAVGRVVAVGQNVRDFAIGNLVACGGAGKANHADYIAVPKNLVALVPAGCAPRDAATATIGTIAMQGVRRSGVQLGDVVCVIGLGLIGQLTVQLLVASGCRVVGIDLESERVTRAKSLGMNAGSTSKSEFLGILKVATDGKGADVTLITAATKSSQLLNDAMEYSRIKGKVVLVGDVGLDLKREIFYRKEIDLLMSTSYGPGRYDTDYEDRGKDYPIAYVRWTLNRNMSCYLDLIARGSIKVNSLIDRVVLLENVSDAYLELTDRKVLGAIIDYGVNDEKDARGASGETAIKLRGHRLPLEGRINYALVGAGAFGTSMLVPQMDKMSDMFFLKAVVSRSGINGSNFARSKGVEVLASELNAILEKEDIKLALVATRHSDHADQVSRLLRAGKHVFVEKPLAISWDQLNQVHTAYTERSSNSVLMVGFNRRFSPPIKAIYKELSDRSAPLIMQYRMNAGFIPDNHWIQGPEGGGRNIGEACHIYDLFRFFADSHVIDISVQAIAPSNTYWRRNDNFIATISYADGSVATLTYTSKGPRQGMGKEKLELFCDGEAWIVDDYRSAVRVSDQEILWKSSSIDKGHFAELRVLGESLETGGKVPIDFEELMETTSVALHVEDLIYGRELANHSSFSDLLHIR